VLALIAHGVFLQRYPMSRVPAFDRQVAPALAMCVGAVAALGLRSLYYLYRLALSLWAGSGAPRQIGERT
jgi:hypothetical protein